MPEGDPVYVEPPEGLYEHSDTVWCLKRALNGLRDASRLFHEHFAAVLTSRLGFTRSEAQPTLFVDLARNVFSAVHVDDLIMVGSSSQLSEVVGEMKQYFTMKVTHPLSASFTQTYVGARYLRDGDATWELPTARYVTGMLNEHGMQNAKPVVTLVVIATMMTMSLRKRVPKSIAVFDALWAKVSSWHRDDQTLLLLRTVLRGLWHVLQNRTSLRRSVSCDICEVCRISD